MSIKTSQASLNKEEQATLKLFEIVSSYLNRLFSYSPSLVELLNHFEVNSHTCTDERGNFTISQVNMVGPVLKTPLFLRLSEKKAEKFKKSLEESGKKDQGFQITLSFNFENMSFYSHDNLHIFLKSGDLYVDVKELYYSAGQHLQDSLYQAIGQSARLLAARELFVHKKVMAGRSLHESSFRPVKNVTEILACVSN